MHWPPTESDFHERIELDALIDKYEHALAQVQQPYYAARRSAPKGRPFLWVTQSGKNGQPVFPADMSTAHLFYTLRMIFNNTTAPAFRVVGPGEHFKRYRDVEKWDARYKREAYDAFMEELATRDDLDADLRNQLRDLRMNFATQARIYSRR